MKKSKLKFLSFIIILLVLFSIRATTAQADESGDYTYTVSNGEATITEYTGSDSTARIIIPDSLGGAAVTGIGPYAFEDSSEIISVTIPKGVTSIAEYAFYNCVNLNTIKAEPSTAPTVDPTAFTNVPSAVTLEIETETTGYNSEPWTLFSKPIDGMSTGIVNEDASEALGEADDTDITVAAKIITGITITTAPTKTEYTEGDSFDPAGMAVTAAYNDESTTEVTDYTAEPSGALSTADATVTVYFEGQTAVQAIIVAPKIVTGITITTAPTKTEYTEGDSFDPTGMAVTAAYSDGSTTEVTGYTAEPSGALSTADATVTVSYEGQTAVQTIIVNPKTATEVAVPEAPEKLAEAETLTLDPSVDLSGIVITAASTSYNSIKIKWGAIAGASGYEVWRAPSSTSTYSRLTDLTSTSYIDTGLTTGTSYYYKVRPYTTTETTTVKGDYSAVVSAFPKPVTPKSVTAASASSDSIETAWGTVAGASGYEVFKSLSSTGPYSRVTTTESKNYVNTGLISGVKYYYKIRAYTKVGTTNVKSSYSIAVSAIPENKLTMPDGFTSLPFNFYRGNDGKIYHDFNFEQYKPKDAIVIYVASYGNDSRGNGTEASPFKNIAKALDLVAETNGKNYIIKCLDVFFKRGSGAQARTIDGKTVAIVPSNPENKVIITNHYVGLKWTEVGTGTWKATRSSVYSVYDLKDVDGFGVPKPYTNKLTLEESLSEAGTWYTDDVDIWIHTRNGSAPNDTDYVVNVNNAFFEPTLVNGATLYVENVVFISGRSSAAMVIKGDTTNGATGTFIANNSIFTGGDLRAERTVENNALSIINVKNTYLFNSIAAYGSEDGFNYHYSGVPASERRDCLVIEYNSTSYGHGQFSTTETSNSSTSHNGASVLRIGGNYFNSKGPVVNDANGCFSVYFDSNSRDSLAITQKQRAAFRSDNDGETIKGKMFLINSSGGGEDTYSVYSGDDMEITLQGFTGDYFPTGFIATILD